MEREGVARCQRTYQTRDGAILHVDVQTYLETINGQITWITIAREKIPTETKEKNDGQCEYLDALNKLMRQEDVPDETVMQLALEYGVRFTLSAYGSIFLVNQNETELAVHAWSSRVQADCTIPEPNTFCKVTHAGLLGTTVQTRGPLIVNDYHGMENKLDLPSGHVPMHRLMSLPVIDLGHITMVVGVANKAEDYTDDDVLCLSLLMETAWRTLQRNRLETELLKTGHAARKANEAKSHFLANMSHELRTPLNGILGMTQILMGTHLTPAQQEYLSLSMDAGRHLTKVLNDLLSLSSVETGVLEAINSKFNLVETVTELIDSLMSNATAKSLRLILEKADDMPERVYGDASKLRQILINLLLNAIKFTDTGEVKLTMKRGESSPENISETQTILFSVSDTGIGIPSDQHTAIFDSFTLGEDYLTKQYGGTGLGLSISRQLARLLGGMIHLESIPGAGSIFTLSLPFQIIAEGHSEAVCTKLPCPLKILLAEDEQVNSIMASRLLRKAGHSVTTVGNGQQAIDALSRGHYDLVLMDVQMPVINGIQATEIIRSGAVENVPNDLPVIGLTAFARSADKKRFLDAGMEMVVTKPYEADELIRAVSSVMRHIS